jgi:hypothetical protein
MVRLARRVAGFILFAAYMWFFWDLWRVHVLAPAPDDRLRFFAGCAANFILLVFGAWLFDRVWPPRKRRQR